MYLMYKYILGYCLENDVVMFTMHIQRKALNTWLQCVIFLFTYVIYMFIHLL